MNRPGCEETPKVPLGVSIHYFKKWSAQGVKHTVGELSQSRAERQSCVGLVAPGSFVLFDSGPAITRSVSHMSVEAAASILSLLTNENYFTLQ